MKSYDIQDREAGNTIKRNISLEEAEKRVMEWEKRDKKDGVYTPDFYEIVESKRPREYYGNNLWRDGEKDKNGLLHGKQCFFSEQVGGKLMSLYDFEHGKKDGFCRGWYKNDNISFEKFYVAGKPHGEWKTWYKNGVLESESHWKNGKQEGVQRWYHENGKLRSDENYVGGKEEGPQKYWYENGKIRAELNHKQGRQDGVWKTWYENGQMESESRYENGQMLSHREWHDNGELKKEVNYKNGQAHGVVKHWRRDGSLEWETYYVDGRKVKGEEYYKITNPSPRPLVESKRMENGLDCQKQYYENGQLMQESFRKDKGYNEKGVHITSREGTWREWWPDGTPKWEMNWKDDKEHGVQRDWHANGVPSWECWYKDGRKEGLEIEWNEEGKRISEKTYKNGVEVKPAAKQVAQAKPAQKAAKPAVKQAAKKGRGL